MFSNDELRKKLEAEVEEHLLTADPASLTPDPFGQQAITQAQSDYQASAVHLTEELTALALKSIYSKLIRGLIDLARKRAELKARR